MGGTKLVIDILDRTLDGMNVTTSLDTVRCLIDLFRVLAVFRQGLDQVLQTTVEVSPQTSVEEGEEQEARPPVHKNAYEPTRSLFGATLNPPLRSGWRWS